jgi:hypothetical protein
MFDGTWFEGGPLDNIFGLGELATFDITTEIVEGITFGGRSIFSGAGIPGEHASGGVLFGRADCHTKCSKIKRPRYKLFTHMKWNGIMEWNGMEWNNGME